MRTARAALASLRGLGAGYAVGVACAYLLKTSVPDADLVWNMVSPLRIGAWIIEAAHGIPTVINTAAGVSGSAGSIERLGELLSSGGGGSDLVFSFSLFLVPISVLAIVGIVVAWSVRRARPSTPRELLAMCAACAATHGVVLALLAWATSYRFAASGRFAPEVGLGPATGQIAIDIGHAPLVALLIGATWGAAFAAAGGLSALPMRSAISSDDRIVLIGWMRGLGASTGIIAAALFLGGAVAMVTGRAPSLGLLVLGGILLSANAAAAGLVASSGVSMAVALDAGPFTGWERVDFLNVGTSGETAPPYLWAALLIPLVAGVVAGRFARRRSSYGNGQIALRFGVLWGLGLAVLAMLLRVRVLSTFSVGGLDLGGGSAAFDPLVALVAGAVWGTVAAFLGTRTAVRPAGAASDNPPADNTWTCGQCGITNATEDAFCVSCGHGRI